jgi:ankyrin repeat protein
MIQNFTYSDSVLDGDLLKAVRDQDESEISKLISQKADVNARDGEGQTPLLLASGFYGNLKIVKMLIKHNADVDAVDYDNESVLYKACSRGNLEILKFFVKNFDFDINQKNRYGVSLLMRAAIIKHSIMVKFLSKSGAEVDARDEDGDTALLASVSDLHMVRLLLSLKADITAVNNKGHSVLTLCAREDARTVEDLINFGAEVDHKTSDGDTALILAAKFENFDVVKVLIERNADINHRNYRGQSALFMAIKYHNFFGERFDTKLTKFLIDSGAETENVLEMIDEDDLREQVEDVVSECRIKELNKMMRRLPFHG